jgi:hypothetical protein
LEHHHQHLAVYFFPAAALCFFRTQPHNAQITQDAKEAFVFFLNSGFHFFSHSSTTAHGAFIFSPMDVDTGGFIFFLQPFNYRG